MRKLYSIFTSLVLSWTLTSGSAVASDPSESMVLDYIVAVVNSEVITHNELERRVALIRAQLEDAGTPLPNEQTLHQQVLEYLINEDLQLQMAQENGITVDDITLNQAIISVAEQNGLSLQEFREALASDGYTYEQFRDDFRNEMTIGQLQQQQLVNNVQVTDREIDLFLQQNNTISDADRQYRLGHILIALSNEPTPEELQSAELRVDEVMTALNSGEDFQQLAVGSSNSFQALQGGDLGWRRLAEVPTLFVDDVSTLSIGDVSGPYRNESGFHIISLLDRSDSATETHLLEQTKVRHILIQTNEVVSDQDARRQLENIRNEILADGDAEQQLATFSRLARANSDDINSISSGGDLDWVSPGTLEPSFELEMNQLTPGEVSTPFETPFGWHIILVEDRQAIDNTEAFERTQVREYIQNRKFQEALQTWLRELRDEAHVQIRDPSLVQS